VKGKGQVEEMVADASVITKWYIIEDLRENALKIRDNYIEGKVRVLAPSVMSFEVLNAAMHGRKDIDPRKLRER